MIDVQTRNYSNLQLELGIEVPRGTQFFQVFIREFCRKYDWGVMELWSNMKSSLIIPKLMREMSHGSHQVTKQSSGVIL